MIDRRRLLAGGLGVAALAAAPAPDWALTGVTVVDVRAGRLLPGRSVLVRGERIAAVAQGAPAGLARVDGRGGYLIPGLWDMETHLSWAGAPALKAMIAHGVTGVRDLGGDPFQLAGWAQAVRSGARVGPQIRQVGPMLHGKSFNRWQYALGSPDQARAAVRLLKFEGVDGVEIERRVPADVYAALIEEAKAQGLPLYGHVPLEVSPREAVAAGQASIDNIETLYDGTFRAAHPRDRTAAMDAFLRPGGEGDALFAAMAAKGVAVTPVLGALERILADAARGAPPAEGRAWVAASNRLPFAALPPDDVAELTADLPRLRATAARMQAAGVTILAGSDVAGDRVPGLSLQQELAALQRAGLTPLQALQAATLNPARVLKAEADHGAVEPGRVADLVLLDADPLKDASAVARPRAVVVRGRLFDRPALDRLLAEAAQEAATA